MYENNNKLIFSSSDFIVFLDSPFASWMERAKSLAIVVGNPDLLTTRANSPEQMKKINVFLQLIGKI